MVVCCPHCKIEFSRKNQCSKHIESCALSDNKKKLGQFYTTNSAYILDGFQDPPSDIRCFIEPFAGQGDIIDWIKTKNNSLPIESYDIDPKRDDIIKKDTLVNPPDYSNAWIITNPPYLARNKSQKKDIYDLYGTNDLYKCFILSVVKNGNCKGGIFIIPAGFFFSPRDIDVRVRSDFMKKYKINKIKYFEETVFEDTSTTIVAVAFEKSESELNEQNVEWELLPAKERKIFNMSANNNWIIGGDIYHLPVPDFIKIRRYVEGQVLKENENQTFITLNALDSGTAEKRICLEYKKDYIYPARDCSRTYATIRITGKKMSENEQIVLCKKFNDFVEEKRKETWSLFLPQFRESKEYARKRIPFELAYRIIAHIIGYKS
jgi:hypothetical protein